ncbi:FGGY-family carbohydrate kinase [Oceaniovalibus sp. ACAM 378]|uniref:FGGY-family carbohydrate kinase n=1 Tax=Oceaniovalibus sp. ACAM 378 TaxID=2599923 RepID=UPI0011D8B4BF|nr:FGGY-family carbohydrate kinase [Oceaniovalibus sp. ACAM 378]TYB84340.1 carbohydrate kinase [Oceaniovalibus sp. ACAM 378]
MSKDIVIAIDAGGTSVKVVAFDLTGCELTRALADVQTEHFPDGRVERPLDQFWEGICSALRKVVSTCGSDRILSIGCTGFGNGLFAVDARGYGTRAGIVSVDHRAQPLVDELCQTGLASKIEPLVGLRLWGGQGVMQFAHLARYEPEVMARTRWVLSCKDFIRLRLTGEVWTDPTDASGCGMMDIARRDYALAAFDLLGLGNFTDRLPPIAPSDAVSGHISETAAAETGLPQGTPVAGSMMDVAACYLGAGAEGVDTLTMIAGTWSINILETDAPTGATLPILNMLYRGSTRLIAEGSPCSAANLGWFLDNVMDGRITHQAASHLVAKVPVQTRRCQFLPHVFGPDPRRGAFINLGAQDNLGTMLRSIFESVAFQALLHAEDIARIAGRTRPERVRLAGGAAQSSVWAQIFADITQREVEAVASSEVGALGAVICAAVAGGAYPDLLHARAGMTRVARRYQPNLTHTEFYRAGFDQFKHNNREGR